MGLKSIAPRFPAIASLFLSWFGVLAPGCRPGDPPAEIDLDSVRVEVGTGGLRDGRRWNRVIISARARDAAFAGEVVVSGRDTDGVGSAESFRRRFDVARAMQTLEVPVRPRGDWAELVLSFQGGGWSRGVRLPMDWSQVPSFSLLGIGDHPASSVSPVSVKDWLGLQGVQEIGTGVVAPANLPRHFLGYDVTDLVIVSGTSLAAVDRVSLEALREWVRRGGVVAAIPSPAWSSELPEPARELFGLEANPSPVTDPRLISDLYRQRPGNPAAPLPEGSFYSVRPLPGAAVRRAGLLLENRFGSGRAYLLTFVPARSSAGGRVRQPLPALALRPVVKTAARQYRTVANSRMADVESAAVRALVWLSGFRYPPRSTVLLFVLGYLGVGFGLTGAFFGRRKRLERMYIVSLALAVLCSIGILYFGFLSGIKELSVDEVTVATVRADGRSADAATVLGIASPRRGTIQPVSTGADDAIFSQPRVERRPWEVRWNDDDPDGERVLPLEYRISGRTIEIPSLTLYPNASRYLRLDHPVDLGGEFRVRYLRGSRPHRVEIANGTDLSLRLFLVEGGKVSEKGSLLAGRTESYLSAHTQNAVSLLEHRDEDPDSLDDYYIGAWYSEEKTRARLRIRLFTSLAAREWHEEETERNRSPHGRFLVAETGEFISPAGDLGRIRHSTTYLILDLNDPEEP